MTNQQTPEIYGLHTVPNKGERPWCGIYTVRADAEHDAKVMRDVTGRDWSVVRLVVADTAATPTGPITRYEVVDCIDSKHVPAVIPNGAGPWVRYEDHAAALCRLHAENEALRATHVQNPAEIEHVAGDVSKNGAELNMSTQQAVGNSGFDHKTAADFLSGKTVSDEALRKFVAASRSAHDARAALHAKMLSLQGELASREAEIALLKRSLLDAEAAAPQPPTAQADSVLEDAAWMPLTPELLTAIESGDLGNRFWIAAHNSNEPQIGVYEWRQGRNPHGFNSALSRYGASEITHVLPYKPPALPAASPQARRKP